GRANAAPGAPYDHGFMPGTKKRMRRSVRGAALAGVAVLAVALLVAVPTATRDGSAGAGSGARAGAAAPRTTAATDGTYAIVDSAGGVMTFGGAGYAGDTLELPLQKPIVGGAADPAR